MLRNSAAEFRCGIPLRNSTPVYAEFRMFAAEFRTDFTAKTEFRTRNAEFRSFVRAEFRNHGPYSKF